LSKICVKLDLNEIVFILNYLSRIWVKLGRMALFTENLG
jgi:hypothetical protein